MISEDKILDILQDMKSDMQDMKSEMKGMKSQLEENTQILRALEHNTEVNKAEHDNMTHDIAEILGEVKSLRKDLSTVEIVTANNYADIARLKAVK